MLISQKRIKESIEAVTACFAEKMNLQEIVRIFRKEDISGEDLLGMTREDLAELQIPKLGQRKKLMDAIQKLKQLNA